MNTTYISPRDILEAFSQAKILVSMSDGPMIWIDSQNVPYVIIEHTGPRKEGVNSTWMARAGATEREFADELRETYFEELIKYARAYGDDVLIEWRRWPEIEIAPKAGKVYSRLTIRTNPNPEKVKYEQRQDAARH